MKTFEAERSGGPSTWIQRPRVLLVDDEQLLLRALGRIIDASGFEPAFAETAQDALEQLEHGKFDAIVSDIHLPDLDGVELLKQVRSRDRDVPVIFITGAPSVETAMKAVEHGALRYLPKPVTREQLTDAVTIAVRTHQEARAKRAALERVGVPTFGGDLKTLAASFGRVLDSLWLAYQPIVSWSRGEVIAYEALMRSPEPTLPNPPAVLGAAERLGRLPQLGQRIRRLAATNFAGVRDGQAMFVNIHPLDLFDEDLFAADAPLSRVASDVVLEITERALLEGMDDLNNRIRRLRELGFRFAIDDLGAGYAGLNSLARFEPEIVKLDMGLVRDIEMEPTKQKLVRSMCSFSKDVGTITVAEGVETVAERDVLLDLGCDLLQGYLFAVPGPAFPEATLR